MGPTPRHVFTSTVASAAHCCARTPTNGHAFVEIHHNLLARIDEARREGWLGEVDGLQVSLAGAKHKLAQLDEQARRATTVDLGLPGITSVVAAPSPPTRHPHDTPADQTAALRAHANGIHCLEAGTELTTSTPPGCAAATSPPLSSVQHATGHR